MLVCWKIGQTPPGRSLCGTRAHKNRGAQAKSCASRNTSCETQEQPATIRHHLRNGLLICPLVPGICLPCTRSHKSACAKLNTACDVAFVSVLSQETQNKRGYTTLLLLHACTEIREKTEIKKTNNRTRPIK